MSIQEQSISGGQLNTRALPRRDREAASTPLHLLHRGVLELRPEDGPGMWMDGKPRKWEKKGRTEKKKKGRDGIQQSARNGRASETTTGAPPFAPAQCKCSILEAEFRRTRSCPHWVTPIAPAHPAPPHLGSPRRPLHPSHVGVGPRTGPGNCAVNGAVDWGTSHQQNKQFLTSRPCSPRDSWLDHRGWH